MEESPCDKERRLNSEVYSLDEPEEGRLPIPVGLNGLALGLSGAASVLLELFPGSAVVGKVALGCQIWGALYWVIFVGDRCSRPWLVKVDFDDARLAFGYGACQMTFLFAWVRLVAPYSWNALAIGGLWFGALAQLIIFVAFMYLCLRDTVLPEPLYNPPTVNCAVTSIVGATYLASFSKDSVFQESTVALVLASFVFAILLMCAFVPPQVYRVLAFPDRVAASAAIGMLQAPCSLNALTWGTIRRQRGSTAVVLSQSFDANIAHVLFGLSTFVLWVTIYGVFQRRQIIKQRGFALDWAAFTFPSCSSAVAALQYTSTRHAEAATLAPKAKATAIIGRVYAIGLALVVLTVVASVVIGNALLVITSWLHVGHQKTRKENSSSSILREKNVNHHEDGLRVVAVVDPGQQ